MGIKKHLKKYREKIWKDVHKICFCHVPKCAGTAVNKALSIQSFKLHERLLLPNFGINLVASERASRLSFRSMMELREDILAYALSMPKYKYVSAHVACRPSIVKEFCDTWHFVTVLRNPVDRWISEYIYNTYGPQSWARNTLPIEEYVDSETGKDRGMKYLLYFSNIPTGFEGNIQPYINEAVDNLAQFSVVGISEDMTTFSKTFEDRFGRKIKVSQINSSPRSAMKQNIKDDKVLMDKIEKLCEADQIIYRRIAERISCFIG